MNFVIGEYFTFGGRRFLIKTGMVWLNDVPDYEKQVGNAAEFVEVSKGAKNAFGEYQWFEAGKIETKTKRYLYSLVKTGELVLE